NGRSTTSPTLTPSSVTLQGGTAFVLVRFGGRGTNSTQTFSPSNYTEDSAFADPFGDSATFNAFAEGGHNGSVTGGSSYTPSLTITGTLEWYETLVEMGVGGGSETSTA